MKRRKPSYGACTMILPGLRLRLLLRLMAVVGACRQRRTTPLGTVGPAWRFSIVGQVIRVETLSSRHLFGRSKNENPFEFFRCWLAKSRSADCLLCKMERCAARFFCTCEYSPTDPSPLLTSWQRLWKDIKSASFLKWIQLLIFRLVTTFGGSKPGFF